jgi:23S rRNA (pseudouridine1915-N3)-methyltransferase
MSSRTPQVSIELLCIGKMKGSQQAYLEEGFQHFAQRLQGYCNLTVVEVPEEKQKANTPPEAVMEAEGKRIIQALRQRADYVVVLTEHAQPVDSPCFASQLKQRHPGLNPHSLGKLSKGKSHLVFVVGGANGLCPNVLALADWKLSLSPMTFPHQMVRLLWAEQLYRAFRILNNEPYHK